MGSKNRDWTRDIFLMEAGSDLCLDLLFEVGEVGNSALGPGYSGGHSKLPIPVRLAMARSENFLRSFGGDLMD